MNFVYWGNFAINVGEGHIIRVTEITTVEGTMVRIEMTGNLKAEIHNTTMDRVMKKLVTA